MYVLSLIRVLQAMGKSDEKIGFLYVFLNPQGIMPNVNLVTIPEVDH